jgi:ankyrin repeat protein
MIDFDRTLSAIMEGDLNYLQRVATENGDFPSGRDGFVGRSWLRNAIDVGSIVVVRWMLEHGSPVNYTDDEGYPALHAAIDRDNPDRPDVIELLCVADADVNARGINDWTPLHLAAARNDLTALRILLHHGADRRLRTRIDDYATPAEEARILGATEAAALLERTD